MKYKYEKIDEAVVALDIYNSDLNLVIDASKYSAHPLTNEGFAFMWAGVRATHGAAKGKICFEVKVLEHLDVSHLPVDEPNPTVVRVGVSVESSTLQLGEDPLSYGYGGTGKTSTNCQFKDFGGSFMAGDCILCAVNFDADQVQIGFAKNGKFLGWAFRVNKPELQGKALYPHVLTKNCSFEVNLGQREEPYFPLPEALKDYTFIGCLPVDERIGGTRPPEQREDCEMIMMCGLPGAGKSVWAAEYSSKNPEKKYNVLGTNNIIDKMKVMGLPRKRNYAGRWDVLIQMATKCLNKMFEIGSKLKRNYILDQTNVYPTAQRRKMRNFEGFKRIAVVVVPTEEEYKRRCDKRDREEGKEVPDQAVLEMKANFKLPEMNDIFDDVIFTELQKDEAEELVKKYNEEGRMSVGPSKKMFKPNDAGSNKGYDNGRGNFIPNRGGSPSRGSFDNGRGRRGSFGGNRGGYDGGNRGGYDGGNRGGYDGGRGDFSNRSGFDSGRGGYGGRGGYMGSRGGFEGRSDFDGRRGGFEGGRGGFEGGRGGFDGGRGGFDSGRGGFNGGRRGGFDGGRGGYDSGRGGFDSGRGGFDSGRGGFADERGGFDGGRGGFDGGRGGFDGGRSDFDGGRGGFDGGRRGGFDGGRGGFDSGRRGGFDSGRGSFEGGRGSFGRGRGGFGGRGSFDSSRGGNGGRGGFDGARGGYSSERGGFDNGRGNGNNRGGFDRKRSYDEGLGNNSGNYDYDSSSYNENSSSLPPSTDMTRTITSALVGRGSSRGRGSGGQGSYSDRDYNSGNNANRHFSDSGKDFNSGQFNSRNQSGSRGGSMRGGSFNVRGNSNTSGNNSGGNFNSRDGFSNEGYRRNTSNYDSGYGSYDDYNDKSQSGFRSGPDNYSSKDTSRSFSAGPPGSFKKESTQGTSEGSSLDTGNRTARTTVRPSGRTGTRWSAETTPTYPQTNAVTTTHSTYSSYVTPIKTESTVASGRSQYDTFSTFSQNNPPPQGFPAATTYGYQQPPALTSTITPAHWTGTHAPPPPPPPPVNPVGQATADQSQWSQYYQQTQPNQYFSQYYRQPASATPPTYTPAYGTK